MAKFAIIEGTNVVNIIVADSLEIAEQVAGGKTCVEYTNEPASPGGTYIDGVFSIPPYTE